MVFPNFAFAFHINRLLALSINPSPDPNLAFHSLINSSLLHNLLIPRRSFANEILSYRASRLAERPTDIRE